MLEFAFSRSPTCLVVGVEGCGKSMLAAIAACSFAESVWFSATPADRDWKIFAPRFAAAIRPQADRADEAKSRLVVFSDIHHLYNADWFERFFALTVASVRPPDHFLLLSRVKPQVPTLRFRSKQMLRVIEETT